MTEAGKKEPERVSSLKGVNHGLNDHVEDHNRHWLTLVESKIQWGSSS